MFRIPFCGSVKATVDVCTRNTLISLGLRQRLYQGYNDVDQSQQDHRDDIDARGNVFQDYAYCIARWSLCQRARQSSVAGSLYLVQKLVASVVLVGLAY